MEKDFLKQNGITSDVLAEWHLCHCMTFKQIAERLKCSVGTIHNLFVQYGLLRNVRNYGWKLSEGVRKEISKRNTGRKHSAETKEKMKKSARIKFEKGFHTALWKGGVKRREDGYIAIWKPKHPFATGGYVLEHRLVMEKEIGRYLKPEEVVHHKNGIRNDNRIENLQLFKNGSEHQRYHALYTRKRNGRGGFA